jgi:hypothetical protein
MPSFENHGRRLKQRSCEVKKKKVRNGARKEDKHEGEISNSQPGVTGDLLVSALFLSFPGSGMESWGSEEARARVRGYAGVC